MAPITRRQAVWLTGGAAATVLGAAGVWQLLPSGSGAQDDASGGASHAQNASEVRAASYVHVIAHADDGLFFQNPELKLAIASGAPAVTVCLTGGESDGINEPLVVRRKDKKKKFLPNRPNFVRARMNGLRAAHAYMATGRWDAPWTIEAVELIPGFQVEKNTLRDFPNVKIYWMELQEARALVAPRPVSLRGLWVGATQTLPTLLPTESPVEAAYAYTRQDVVDSLVKLFSQYNPTVVRTLDPSPVHRPDQDRDFGNGKTPPVPSLRLPEYLDHQDHTYSTYFAQQALTEYWAQSQIQTQAQTQQSLRRTSVEHYRGYMNANLPYNLGPVLLAPKQAASNIYAWNDGRDCGDPAGCGDLKVSTYASGPWSRSTRTTAPGATDWVAQLSDGRLAAFAVMNGTVLVWTEQKAGQDFWVGPTPLAGSGLFGQVSAVRRPDGKLVLFAVRTTLAPDHNGQFREVVTCQQTGWTASQAPAFGPWQSLGSPDGDPLKSMEMGFPSVLVEAGGTTTMAVRNWSGSISYRRQPANGAWSAWTSVAAPAGSGAAPHQPYVGIQDGIALAATPDGNLHVFAAAAAAVVQWSTNGPGTPLRPAQPTGLPASCTPVTALALQDGTIRLLYREPSSAQVIVADLPVGTQSWRVTDTLDTVGGYGRVVGVEVNASTTPGLVLATRNNDGGVSVAAASGVPDSWVDAPRFHLHVPGVALDAQGRAVVVALGADGQLTSVRKTRAGADSPLTDWPTAAPISHSN
ncbi:PIG-L family deacetylase [Streptacidiphilus anmyonensis]|uniref:PIG-L family deacetylase n=1 Tax=Streptacidiphilus anmyonensis TaxID=405782 RepID=UPI0006937A9A|nr:PIG-L family deacetylase [Streptacidiphilus anmyonensis]